MILDATWCHKREPPKQEPFYAMVPPNVPSNQPKTVSSISLILRHRSDGVRLRVLETRDPSLVVRGQLERLLLLLHPEQFGL